MKSRIDISKQLIKLIIKIKKEYENVNGKLRESFALCHCAEAGDDQDEEFQKRFNEKKRWEKKMEIWDSKNGNIKCWKWELKLWNGKN